MRTGELRVGSGCNAKERKSRLMIHAKRLHGLGFFQYPLGQCCPQHCPRVRGAV
jgi:hypothetical protein